MKYCPRALSKLAEAMHCRPGRAGHVCGLIAAALLLAGCSGVGPRAISVEHAAYTDVLVQTADEQLLRNLVRLRYRDRPLFLEVSSITSQIVVGASAGLSGNPLSDDVEESVGAEAGVSYEEQPVITYQPLTGSEFMTRYMLPVRLDTLVQLSQSGWSIERILRICAQSMNGLPNAPTAAGPTPERAPQFREFAAAAGLLRRLQVEGVVQLGFAADNGLTEPLLHVADDASAEAARELSDTLMIAGPYVRLTRGLGAGSPDRLALQTRSLNGMLHYLSHGVEIPAQHAQAGLVTRTTDRGSRFDWSGVTEGLLRVRSSVSRPGGAAVQVNYRDHWYWIADDDLDSKSTFSFLTQLLALQSEASDAPEPMLTIPLR